MTEKKSGQVDLLHGPILKSLIIFMAPIVVSYAFQQLYNAVDTAIVGNILGENSLAAMGSCSSVFDLFVGFANSLGAGSRWSAQEPTAREMRRESAVRWRDRS